MEMESREESIRFVGSAREKGNASLMKMYGKLSTAIY